MRRVCGVGLYNVVKVMLTISVVLAPCILTSSEHEPYQYMVQLIDRYSYAMDQQRDKPLIDDVPKLYSDALELYTAKRGGAVNNDITCILLLGTFKVYANAIKDKLATSTLSHVSKKSIESMTHWSTLLLEITLEKGLFNFSMRTCDNGMTPMELSCSLLLHKVMNMLISHGLHDIVQLYNCLLLCTANSDVEGFEIVWKQLCSIQQGVSDPCNVVKEMIPAGVMGDALSNTNLSVSDVALFHCKKSNNCVIFEHVCHNLCSKLCSLQSDELSTFLSHHIKLNNDGRYQQHFSQACSFVDVVNGCHGDYGWRTGFVMEMNDCQIPSVDIKQLSTDLLELFASIKLPLLIKGVGKNWKLLNKWTRKYLQQHFGSVEVLGGSIPYGELFGEPFGFATISEYLSYLDMLNDKLSSDYYNVPITQQEKVVLPFYVFDVEVLQQHFVADYTIPAVFTMWNATEHHQFIFGPPGSGAPFHFHCHAVNFLTYGRKKWLLIPPGKAIYSKLHPLKLYSDQHIDVLSQLKPLECVQHSGEMLYIPSSWGHATINFDESIGLAVEYELSNC